MTACFSKVLENWSKFLSYAVKKAKQLISFAEQTHNGCFSNSVSHRPSSLSVSDFVEQTSVAATGAASIIVNDAGKCFCHQDPKSSGSSRNDLGAHTTKSGRVLSAHSFSLLLLHTHIVHPCIQYCHWLTIAQVAVITGYTHTHSHIYKSLSAPNHAEYPLGPISYNPRLSSWRAISVT